ncbi:mitochondrial import receptor subunit TOM20 [Pseudohyphozyma bogoriensis]|nr:mitochondrial import receptor subunit TOM20 [Pseudohyphozyma bogoriensis]
MPLSPPAATTTTTTRVVLATLSVCALAGLGYALVADHSRRSSAASSSSRRQRGQTEGSGKKGEQESTLATPEQVEELLLGAVVEVGKEQVSEDVAGRERYFLEQVSYAEQLAKKGEQYYVAAAVCFYKALRIYPEKDTLLPILEKTQPSVVYLYLLELVKLDATLKTAGPTPPSASDPASHTTSTPESPEAGATSTTPSSESGHSSNGSFVVVGEDVGQSTVDLGGAGSSRVFEQVVTGDSTEGNQGLARRSQGVVAD